MKHLKNSVNPSSVSEKIRQIDPMHNASYAVADEISSGMLFAEVFRDIARYCPTFKSWLIYDGCVWQKDEKDIQVGKLAIVFSRAFKQYVAYAVSAERTESEKKYEQYVLRLGDRSKRLKMVDDARYFLRVSYEELDKDLDLFNCKNGTLNLKTMEFKEHDPADLLTKCANVNFDKTAWSDEWEQFMDQIMEGNAEKIEYIQRCLGYSLTCDTSMEEMYVCFGSSTRNGKSTMLETIGTLMADYGTVMAPETIAEKRTDSSKASPDIISLAGARFVRCSEPPKGMLFNSALVKKLLGRDELKARDLFETERKFVPVFKIWMNTNYLPVIGDRTVFASGRVKLIEFNKHFDEKTQDKRLKDKLQTERNKSGILNWMLTGLQAYREKETAPPECIIQASREYAQMQDKTGNFIRDCLEESTGNNLKMSDVYGAYREWCKEGGFGYDSKRTFKQELISKSVFKEKAWIDGMTVTNAVADYRFSMEGRRLLDKSERYK